MPPDDTYTAAAHFGDVARSLKQNKNMDVDHHGMLLYGHGDGGGGPTAEMLENCVDAAVYLTQSACFLVFTRVLLLMSSTTRLLTALKWKGTGDLDW